MGSDITTLIDIFQSFKILRLSVECVLHMVDNGGFGVRMLEEYPEKPRHHRRRSVLSDRYEAYNHIPQYQKRSCTHICTGEIQMTNTAKALADRRGLCIATSPSSTSIRQRSQNRQPYTKVGSFIHVQFVGFMIQMIPRLPIIFWSNPISIKQPYLLIFSHWKKLKSNYE